MELEGDVLARIGKLEAGIDAFRKRVEKFNPYHDAKGRFSSAGGGAGAAAGALRSGNKARALNRIGGLISGSLRLSTGGRKAPSGEAGRRLGALQHGLIKIHDHVKAGRIKVAQKQLRSLRKEVRRQL